MIPRRGVGSGRLKPWGDGRSIAGEGSVVSGNCSSGCSGGSMNRRVTMTAFLHLLCSGAAGPVALESVLFEIIDRLYPRQVRRATYTGNRWEVDRHKQTTTYRNFFHHCEPFSPSEVQREWRLNGNRWKRLLWMARRSSFDAASCRLLAGRKRSMLGLEDSLQSLIFQTGS
jgi:hypothetical protein